MKALTTFINLDAEVSHVAAYLAEKWDANWDLHQLVAHIRAVAEHTARGWLDADVVAGHASTLSTTRRLMLEQLPDMTRNAGPDYYDAITSLLDHIDSSATRLAAAGQKLVGDWDFDDVSRAVCLQVTEKYPDFSGIRPKGWAELATNYVSLAGWDDYDPEPDRKLFKGVEAKLPYTPDFPARIALPFVLAKELLGKRKASAELISAILAHFMAITQYLNTEKLKQDLTAALPRLAAQEMIFDRNDIATANPFLKVAFKLAPQPYTEQAFKDCIAAQVAFKALTPEEQEKRLAAVDAELEAQTSREILDAQITANQKAFRTLLQTEFEVPH